MDSKRLEQVSFIYKNLEALEIDSLDRIYSRSYILLITYGSLEKDIEGIFASYLKSNNVFSNNYFSNNKIHRGLNYNDIKYIIKVYFKAVVNKEDYDDFKMNFLNNEEITKYKELISLRHNIAHQNNSVSQPSKEQVYNFIDLSIKLRDGIEEYLKRLQEYHLKLSDSVS